MRKIVYAFFMLVSPVLSAINIHNIQITPSNAQSINISLTTEAVELYYYDSWSYSITANVITINAYFIEGFGSTILYLNNNFVVPLHVPQQYVIVVRIFYTDVSHTFKALKDVARIPYRHAFRKP